MKTLPLAIGLGAFLLLAKKKPSSSEIARASALATATSIQQSVPLAQQSRVVSLELKMLSGYLVRGKVGAAPFGPGNPPTLYEALVLYAVDPFLIEELPLAYQQDFWQNIRRHHFTGAEGFFARTFTTTEKLVLGLSILPQEQTRLFAADCLEMILSSFTSEFPGNVAGRELIAALRSYAQHEMEARSLEYYAAAVLRCYPTQTLRDLSPFAKAASLASTTPLTLSRQRTLLPAAGTEETIQKALRLTRKIVVKVRQEAARDQTRFAARIREHNRQVFNAALPIEEAWRTPQGVSAAELEYDLARSAEASKVRTEEELVTVMKRRFKP